MRVRLNLATKPLVSHRRFLAAAGTAGVFAGIIFLALGWHVYSRRRAEAEYRTKADETLRQIASYQQQRGQLEAFFKEGPNAELHDRAAFLNGVIDARSFNWTQMFKDLEKILPGGVRVVSIEPVQTEGAAKVKLKVGAVNDEAKLKFLHAVEDSKAFTHVTLLSDHVMATPQGGDVTLLELTAVYSRI